jgi:melibiose permease
MMDIPYWSMIPAVTRTPKDRENLSMVGRTCAGVGSALIAMFTMLLVGALGGDSERAGFRWVALIVAVIFAVTELVCCISMKETTPSEMKTATVKEMFSALFRNDQAMVVVGSIVLINSALYLTSNFIIYFFKYDLGGAGWKATYTLFSTAGMRVSKGKAMPSPYLTEFDWGAKEPSVVMHLKDTFGYQAWPFSIQEAMKPSK